MKAIKLVRESGNFSLRECKEQVETLSDELEKTHPRQMADSQSIGCAGIVLLAVIGAGGLVAKSGLGF
ncbi:hypothetical protein [Rhodopirellula sp. P2]|uniref:hypothetical protein n=1 Tax=Rhodopirellula sp. P2 TaxID=2127060 RepID=UPI002367AB26|nr:hypothetical protein [Rhodopirellula sp. P2]WDQ15785.1 hypothetical protein PSR62_19390 [Rhodopirellula sp. P2]